MTLAEYKKLGQWESLESLIEDLGLENVFESVWDEPYDEATRDVSENVLIEETLEAADTEYIFAEGFVDDPINQVVYVVLTTEAGEEETDASDLEPEVTTSLSLRQIVSGTEAEVPFYGGYDLVGFKTNAENELELGWEDAEAV